MTRCNCRHAHIQALLRFYSAGPPLHMRDPAIPPVAEAIHEFGSENGLWPARNAVPPMEATAVPTAKPAKKGAPFARGDDTMAKARRLEGIGEFAGQLLADPEIGDTARLRIALHLCDEIEAAGYGVALRQAMDELLREVDWLALFRDAYSTAKDAHAAEAERLVAAQACLSILEANRVGRIDLGLSK